METVCILTLSMQVNSVPTCMGMSWWLSGKESVCQFRRCRFNPWVSKTPCRRKWYWEYSSILAWEISRSMVGYSPWGHKRVRHDLATKQLQLHVWWRRIMCGVWVALLVWTSCHLDLGTNHMPSNSPWFQPL